MARHKVPSYREMIPFVALRSKYCCVALKHSDDIMNMQTSFIEQAESKTDGALRSHSYAVFLGWFDFLLRVTPSVFFFYFDSRMMYGIWRLVYRHDKRCFGDLRYFRHASGRNACCSFSKWKQRICMPHLCTDGQTVLSAPIRQIISASSLRDVAYSPHFPLECDACHKVLHICNVGSNTSQCVFLSKFSAHVLDLSFGQGSKKISRAVGGARTTLSCSQQPSTVSQLNTIHTTSSLSKIKFNIIFLLTPGFLMKSKPLGLSG